MDSYRENLSKYKLLTPAEEQSLAAEIRETRTALWANLLSYAPFTAPLVDLLVIEFQRREENAPLEELRQVQESSIQVRQRETRANLDKFDQDRTACAKAMALIDLDGDYSSRAMLEITAAESRQRDRFTLGPLPPEGSKPFACYVERVRQADQRLRALKNRFVQANLRLVVTIARRHNRGALPMEDLIQEGSIGLMKAVDRFDGERGYRFSTYATWWIRHSINRAIDNTSRTIRIPTHVAADAQKIGRAVREHEAATGEPLTPKQIAEKTGMPLARIQRLLKLSMGVVSLDETDDERSSLLSKIEDEDAMSIESLLVYEQLVKRVEQAMRKLTAVERDILLCRFGISEDEPMTLHEVGVKHSLSRERIRQLQARALERLRGLLRNLP